MADLELIPSLRRQPQQARSAAAVRRILAAADEIAGRDGVEELTTSRIASEAGVSIGSLYTYFPDKHSIVQALAQSYKVEHTELMNELERAILEDGSDDPVALAVDAFARQYRERPGFRALWLGREFNAELREVDRENHVIVAEKLAHILVGLGFVEADDPQLPQLAQSAVLVVNALLLEAFLIDPDGDPGLIEQAKWLMRLAIADLAAQRSQRG
jgi:AcrR family transcriptional regulator